MFDDPAGVELSHAQAHQGGDGLTDRGRRGGDMHDGRAVRQRFALQFGDDAHGQLGSDARGAGNSGLIAPGGGGGQLARRHDVQDGQSGLGPHTLNGLKGDETAAILAGQKTVEAKAA